MKNLLKVTLLVILLSIFVSWFALWTDMSFFNSVDSVSIDANSSWNVVNAVEDIWSSILTSAKFILMWIFVIYMVYNGIMMVISKWSDEEELSKSKRQIWYSIVAILFINIPFTLYDSFNTNTLTWNWWIWTTWENSPVSSTGNIFFNFNTFSDTIWTKIIWFMRVVIFGLAVFFIMLSWIQILTSRWREEVIKESKMKIIYSVFALIFVWVIGSWQNFVFTWNLSAWTSLFGDMANLALFLAAPVAIFFLTMAAYYYIISAWDEEKVKKAKNIVINTVIATIILLAAYTFLLDLATL